MSKKVMTWLLRGLSLFALLSLILLVLSNLLLTRLYHIPIMGEQMKIVAGLLSGSLLLTAIYESDNGQKKSLK